MDAGDIDIDALTPHAGAMRLIGRVVRHDDTRIVCEADSHRAADHPLRRANGLPIICALEYGAQAMAIHGALLAQMGAKPRIGYLVAAHELRWRGSMLDTCAAPLRIEATRLFGSDNQVAYEFSVSAAGTNVMRGRASVVLSGE
jgi:predicted hotdog family 3-hydroxylacyl-ACP dehydratase